MTRWSTTPAANSRAAVSRIPWLLAALTLMVTLSRCPPVWARHEARVDSSQCSYTLVVNELDVSKCPVMQDDARAAGQGRGQGRRQGYSPWNDSPSLPRYVANPRLQPRLSAAESGADKGPEVTALRSQVKELEGRLLEEMVRSRELNSTLARHGTALGLAEKQLKDYSSNMTTIYRAMVFVQRQLHRYVGGLVGCLTDFTPFNVPTTVRADTVRQKLQIKLSVSSSQSVLTPDQPVSALTL